MSQPPNYPPPGPPGYPPPGPPGAMPGWSGGPPAPSRNNNALLLVLGAVVLVAIGVVAFVVTQGDDDADGSSGDRAAYVEALAFAHQAQNGDDATESDSRCIAESTVDVFGVEALQAVATPEDLRANPDKRLRAWGLSPDETQGSAFYDRLQQCLDIRAAFVKGLPDDIPPGAVACVEQAVDDDLLKRIVVASWVDGDEYLETNPELAADAEAAIAPCESLDG